MIRSFRHRGLKRFYERGDPSLIRTDLRERVEVMLTLLDDVYDVDMIDYH